MSVRALVADDSVLFRRVLTDILGSFPDVEVVGTAPNGRLAISRVREMKPDLLTLDMEMPEMDGLGVLDELKASGEKTTIIVVSSLTKNGGRLTMRALEKGAFDFITKPETSSPEAAKEEIRRELAPRLKALSNRLEIRNILKAPAQPVATARDKAETGTSRTGVLDTISGRMSRIASASKPDLALIGVSTGGPGALARLVPLLPADLGVPVLIVQHMPPIFTQSLAESLSSKSVLAVREAIDGEEAKPNFVYIAPGGKQMRLLPGMQGDKRIQITDDPPENNCKPSVDYLFRSVASNYPGRAMASILTGMGSDGTIGLRLLKRNGCYVIAQSEESCVVYGMPKAAVEAGVVDAVLPIEAIASRITSVIRGAGA